MDDLPEMEKVLVAGDVAHATYRGGKFETYAADKTQELLNRMAQVHIEASVRDMVDNLLMAERAQALNKAGVTYLGMQLQTGRGEVSYGALCASWGFPPAKVLH